MNPNSLGDSINSIVKKEIVNYADTLVNRINSNGYRVSMVTRDYTWGSTGNAGNQGVVLVYAHKLTGIRRYLDALVMTNDYLLGKNPVGYSYITGFGSHSPLQPHSRPMRADFIDEPIPAFVVGGANAGDNGGDEYLNEVVESGAPPAKCYVDIVHSWGSNENAINQNAPWVLILGYLESQYSGVVHTKYHNQQKEKRACALFDAIRKGTSVHVTWQIPERFNRARISIHDLAGREIQSCSIKPSSSAGQSSVDLKNRSGMFVVRMTVDNIVIARAVAGVNY
jgi:hypothetical protein